MSYIYLFISIIAETIATLALKSTQGFTALFPSLVVVCGYSLAFYCLSLTLKEIPVGVVYATWSGLGMVLISLGGYFFYHQTLDLYAWIGLMLILGGVLFMNLLSKASPH
ncbi:MAG: DMT family transporter [Parachlamydiaceae bacterium]